MRSQAGILILCALLSLSIAFSGTPAYYSVGSEYGNKGAEMFTMLHQAEKSTDHFIIWLQGGPGGASMYGDICEIGPTDLDNNNRTSSWAQYADLLFVDQPIGTGWSYHERGHFGYCKSEECVVSNFLEMLTLFYADHPDLAEKQLHIFAESYGGKMASNIALALVERNFPVNLKSVALGDSWISPIHAVASYGDFLLSESLIDEKEKKIIDEYATKMAKALKNREYLRATELWGEQQQFMTDAAGGVNVYNYLSFLGDEDMEQLTDYMVEVAADPESVLYKAIPESRKKWFNQGGEQVFEQMQKDFMKPSVKAVESLLDHNINVAVYSGALDIIVDVLSTERWIDTMEWQGMEHFNKAKKAFIKIDGTPMGYTKAYNNLKFMTILNAGHMVPRDQPETASLVLQQVLDW